MIHWPKAMAEAQVAAMRNIETYGVGLSNHDAVEVREAAFDVIHYLQRLSEAVRRLDELTEEDDDEQ